MIHRRKNDVTLWTGVHPKALGCQGNPQCTCKYHVVNGDEIEAFDDFQEADERFCELTGEQSLHNTIFKKP